MPQNDLLNLLTFEEFSDRSEGYPRYNNFFLFFYEAKADKEMQVYRNAPYFQKFKKEYPELEKRLTKEIIKKLDNLRIGEKKSESLKQFDGDLYEAYKIMRSYGALDTDLSFLRKP